MAQLIRSLSLLEQVYVAIKLNICNGIYKSGEKLVVDDLVKEFGVSRTPIKEALNRLVAEGFLTAINGRGVFVKEYTKDDIINAFEVRMMIENYSLTKINDNLKENDDIIDMIEEDMKSSEDFHAKIIGITGNATLENTYKNLILTNLLYYKNTTTESAVARTHQIEKEHNDIIKALRSKNKLMIERAIISHSKNSLEYAIYK